MPQVLMRFIDLLILVWVSLRILSRLENLLIVIPDIKIVVSTNCIICIMKLELNMVMLYLPQRIKSLGLNLSKCLVEWLMILRL